MDIGQRLYTVVKKPYKNENIFQLCNVHGMQNTTLLVQSSLLSKFNKFGTYCKHVRQYTLK